MRAGGRLLELSRMTDGVHTCNWYCDRPECIKAQRDQLRSLFVGGEFHCLCCVRHGMTQAERDEINGRKSDREASHA